MENFELYNPTKIIFGKNCVKDIGIECKKWNAHKVLLVYGGVYLEKNGFLNEIKSRLNESQIMYVTYNDVQANPCVSQVKAATKLGKHENIDFVLAIGGGSAIDTAKSVALEIGGNDNIEDILIGNKESNTCLPVGVISTIAGSGSESSCSLVLTIDEGKLKRAYDNDILRPKFSFMDPTLTFSLPNMQMISGGCDILMHTLERYFTNTSSNTNLIDRMSEGLMITVMESLEKAIKNPNDYDARANLMWAGSLSHNGLLETGRKSDWACHRLEHELSGLFNVIHGAGLCALWKTWAVNVYKNNTARFVRFAVEVMKVENDYFNQEETALAGIDALDDFFTKIKMPTNLCMLGLNDISDKDIEKMADQCLQGTNGTIGNFKPLNKEEIIKIYHKAKGNGVTA